MTAKIDFETIAAQVHQFYCDKARVEGWRNEFPMPFAQLPEYMKEDNRAAARRIGEVLSFAGLRLASRDGATWTDEEQDSIRAIIEQNIDRLAEGEHDGFTLARIQQNWQLGDYKDVANRRSHLLVRISRFPEQVRKKQEHEKQMGNPPKRTVEEEVADEINKDRNSVRNYVGIIAQTDYRIELQT